MRIIEVVKSLDWILLGASLLLVMISLAMLFSSSDAVSLLNSRFTRQLIALIVSIIVALLIARIPYHSLQRYGIAFYSIGIAGLLIVFFAGQVIRGTTSRLTIAGFQLQPSEFMKFALVIALAWLLARQPRVTWRTILSSGAVMAPPLALILLEPDLGVAVLFVALWVGLLIFAGLSWRWVIAGGVFAGASIYPVWYWFLQEYQKQRIRVFIDPTSDPLGAGYNVVQAMIAFGSGYVWGRGLGHGPQSQLQFLPERHTDFILASIGEELGFIGIVVVLILYTIVLWRILRIAHRTNDLFGQRLAVGVFLVLVASFTVTTGMNMGLLPVTGIPLPLLSYGGSSLVSTFLLIGVAESVHIHSRWVQRPPGEISYLT